MTYNTDTNETSSSTKERNIFTTFSLALFLFIEFVTLANIFTPYISKRRPSARRINCFSNVRVLQGAVEMYNMDKNTFMNPLDINALVNEKYLKNAPYKPESDCEYLLQDDIVYCKFHGFYDEKKEKELRAKEESERTKKERVNFFIFIFICSIPSLFYLFFTINSGKESYICFTILFILIIFISGLPNFILLNEF